MCLGPIGNNAFSNCSRINGEIQIPSSVAQIGVRAFSACVSISSINLVNADSLIGIGVGAFGNCTGVTGELQIPSNVTDIGNSAFQTCLGLQSINLASANSLKRIGNSSFRNLTNVTGTVIIPSGVTTIAGGAFFSSSRIEDMLFVSSASTLTIGVDAFAGLTLIADGTALSNLSGTLDRNVAGGIEFYPPASDSLFRSGTNATGASVGSIGSTLVSNAKSNLGGSMDAATVGVFVTEIGGSAFTAVSGSLTELTIRPGGSLTTIGNQAFRGCSRLTSIDLVSATALVNIFELAFSGCSGASGTLSIPGSVASIRNQAFNGWRICN